MFNGFLQNTFVVYVFVAFVVVVVVVFALRAPNATLWYPIASTCHCFGFSLYFSIVTHLFDFRLFIILHVYRVYCVDATNYQPAPPPTLLLVPHAHTLPENFILRCIPPTQTLHCTPTHTHTHTFNGATLLFVGSMRVLFQCASNNCKLHFRVKYLKCDLDHGRYRRERQWKPIGTIQEKCLNTLHLQYDAHVNIMCICEYRKPLNVSKSTYWNTVQAYNDAKILIRFARFGCPFNTTAPLFFFFSHCGSTFTTSADAHKKFIMILCNYVSATLMSLVIEFSGRDRKSTYKSASKDAIK